MAQFKKDAVRKAILKSAKKLFSSNGYINTSMNAIAKEANVSTSNMYNYFDSKLDILYEVFRPWLVNHMRQLDENVKEISDPKVRLKTILEYIWKEIPASDKGFANNLVQALSSFRQGEHYNKEFLFWFEEYVSRLVEPCLDESRAKYKSNNTLAHAVAMIFDGYVMRFKLTKTKGSRYGSDRVDEVIELFTDLLVNNT